LYAHYFVVARNAAVVAAAKARKTCLNQKEGCKATTTILGTGEYRYQVIEDWAKLRDGWERKDVAAVAVDSKDQGQLGRMSGSDIPPRSRGQRSRWAGIICVSPSFRTRFRIACSGFGI
jgi:hypothetical protein